MTERMSAEASKRKSRGWSDAMDSESIAKRLAIVEDLYACWKSLQPLRSSASPGRESNKSQPSVSDARSFQSSNGGNRD